VVLTANRFRAALEKAVSWGADAYLLKEISSDALDRSLRLVMLGQQIFSTGLMKSIAEAEADEPKPADPLKNLSRRERQILLCLVDGRSNKEIARVLGISEATTKIHLKGLLRKVNAHNRTQVAVWARRNGVVGQMASSGVAAFA
jgi:two-component system nitrate/nitrite response regulator NarL